MRYIIIVILGLLTSCNYRPKEKRLAKFQNDDGEILESFYKKTTDTIEFRRIVSDRSIFKLQSGKIFLGDYALTHQSLTVDGQWGNSDGVLDSLRIQFKSDGFAEKILDERDV